MAGTVVYALWTEDQHSDGMGQLRGLFASLELAQADAAANAPYPLTPWRLAMGYVDNAVHGGEVPVVADSGRDVEQRPGYGYPNGGPAHVIACSYTVEPILVQGLELFTGQVAR